MSKVRMSAVLIGIVVTLFATVPSAFGWWEATGQNAKQGKGPVKFLSTVYFNSGAYSAECWNTHSIQATWSIQAKGQIKQYQAKGPRVSIKQGPDLLIQVKDWEAFNGACARNLAFGVKPTVTISSCEFLLRQPKGALEATMSLVKTCTLKDTFCALQLPAGMESSPESNEGFNVALNQVKLANKETETEANQLGKAIVPGIHMSSVCEPKETNPDEEVEMRWPEFELIGAKAI